MTETNKNIICPECDNMFKQPPHRANYKHQDNCPKCGARADELRDTDVPVYRVGNDGTVPNVSILVPIVIVLLIACLLI